MTGTIVRPPPTPRVPATAKPLVAGVVNGVVTASNGVDPSQRLVDQPVAPGRATAFPGLFPGGPTCQLLRAGLSLGDVAQRGPPRQRSGVTFEGRGREPRSFFFRNYYGPPGGIDCKRPRGRGRAPHPTRRVDTDFARSPRTAEVVGFPGGARFEGRVLSTSGSGSNAASIRYPPGRCRHWAGDRNSK